MSLRAAVKSGVAAAFQAVGDIKVDVIYYSANVQDPLFDYDTETGDKIAQWAVVAAVPLILVQARQDRLLGDASWLIKPGDQVAIIEQSTLNLNMQLEDQIEINGRRWRIINFKSDPAAATYIAQIRLTSYEPVLAQGTGTATTGARN